MRNNFAHLVPKHPNDMDYDFLDLLYAFALAIAHQAEETSVFVSFMNYLLCAIETMTGHMHMENIDQQEYNPGEYVVVPNPCEGYDPIREFPFSLEEAWRHLQVQIDFRLNTGKWFRNPYPPSLQFGHLYAAYKNLKIYVCETIHLHPPIQLLPIRPRQDGPQAKDLQSHSPLPNVTHPTPEWSPAQSNTDPVPSAGEGVPTVSVGEEDNTPTPTHYPPPQTDSTGYQVLTDANGDPMPELYELIQDIAGDLATALPDPSAWCSMVIYLLTCMELHTEKTHAYESALDNLCRLITRRLDKGEWGKG